MPIILKGGRTVVVLCPKCQDRNVTEKKSWILKGGIKKNEFRIHLYKCNNCGHTFRKAEPI